MGELGKKLLGELNGPDGKQLAEALGLDSPPPGDNGPARESEEPDLETLLKEMGTVEVSQRVGFFRDQVVALLVTMDPLDRATFIDRVAKILKPAGVTKGDLREAVNQYLRRVQNGNGKLGYHDQSSAEILENAPEAIRRPLSLVGEYGYAATWIWVKETVYKTVDEKTGTVVAHNPPLEKKQLVPIVIRNDGRFFADSLLPGALPLTELGIAVTLPEIPPMNRIWSGAGVTRFLEGDRPDPADVFSRVVDVLDRFMDFKRSLGEQRTMCELVSCYVLATYLLDAFHVIGYLWPNGDRGSGKTHFLFTTTELAYLGQVILAGGSYASLRDLADYGATLAFDDCETIMDSKRTDPDKRTLLLAGNRRGATVTVKEPDAVRGWVTRHINTFCPRLFSAIKLPDEVLASRTITVPLVRSRDERRANADPLDYEAWPHDRRRLIDDLWALGLTNLPSLRQYYAKAAHTARLSGRDLEPWRAILAVALWLQKEHGTGGLFERMEALSQSYQEERTGLEAYDPTRLLIQALREMFSECQDALSADSAVLEFDTSTLTQRINVLAVEAEVINEEEKFTNPKRVGRLLERLRFQKAPRTAKRKRWKITLDELDSLLCCYGMIPLQQHGTNGKNGNMAQEGMPSCQECQECHVDRDISQIENKEITKTVPPFKGGTTGTGSKENMEAPLVNDDDIPF
jgi:hypothetical protein